MGLISGAVGRPAEVLADYEGSTVNEAAGLGLKVRCKTVGDLTADAVVVLCKVTVINIGKSAGKIRLGETYILDAEGGYYDRSRSALERAGRYEQRLLLPPELAPGASIAGYAAFQVPTGAPGPITFLLVRSIIDSSPASDLGTHPENELYVPVDLEPWGNLEARATVHALETQAADLKTRVAPTPTNTSIPTATLTPTNTPIPTATLTPANTPIPPTATPSRDEATIAALQTEIAALESGTPPATETPIAQLTASPKPANTPKPKATSTPAYPSAVAALVSEDSATTCDRIGWNVWNRSGKVASDAESKFQHYLACGESLGYSVGCVISTGSDAYFGPSAGNVWVLCNVLAINAGSESAFVSPFDFTLVDANNRRHDIDYMALTMVSASEMFPSDSVPPDQSVSGYVAFEIPSSAAKPIRIEINALLDYSLSSESLVIILDPLGTID
jgi:hypothetical protein